jgi:large subunit ribosomal protein L9
MKVLLRDHVEKLGERGDVVNVAPGYARNYLLPKGLALEATPGNLKVLEHQRRVWEARESRDLGDARGVAERLAALRLTVAKRAGENGTLYGSVTNVEIAELLAREGIEVDRRRIVLAEPIKTVGTHDVAVKLHRQVTAVVPLDVVSESGVE